MLNVILGVFFSIAVFVSAVYIFADSNGYLRVDGKYLTCCECKVLSDEN